MCGMREERGHELFIVNRLAEDQNNRRAYLPSFDMAERPIAHFYLEPTDCISRVPVRGLCMLFLVCSLVIVYQVYGRCLGIMFIINSTNSYKHRLHIDVHLQGDFTYR